MIYDAFAERGVQTDLKIGVLKSRIQSTEYIFEPFADRALLKSQMQD